MPVEVMGLMLGHPDMEEARVLIVTDVFPLPVEGTETSVMTDNPEVTNYMIRLSDTIEQTRTETLMGWYHSHPFDVAVHSNAFLSATDVSTQLGWQLSEDRAGHPWLALVVDPLRGIAKGKPEIGAFRCYPPEYTPLKGLAPDGKHTTPPSMHADIIMSTMPRFRSNPVRSHLAGVMWTDERERNARWGDSCVSYYSLSVEYFQSSHSAALMELLGKDVLWSRALASDPLGEESREEMFQRLHKLSEKVSQVESGLHHGMGGRAFGVGIGAGEAVLMKADSAAVSDAATAGGKQQASALAQAVQAASELSAEHKHVQETQAIKHAVFNGQPDTLAACTQHEKHHCSHSCAALGQVKQYLEARRSAKQVYPDPALAAALQASLQVQSGQAAQGAAMAVDAQGQAGTAASFASGLAAGLRGIFNGAVAAAFPGQVQQDPNAMMASLQLTAGMGGTGSASATAQASPGAGLAQIPVSTTGGVMTTSSRPAGGSIGSLPR